MDSRPGFSLEAASDESCLVPLVGGKHVGAVMDTKNGHLLSVLKILQQLKTNTTGESSGKSRARLNKTADTQFEHIIITTQNIQ